MTVDVVWLKNVFAFSSQIDVIKSIIDTIGNIFICLVFRGSGFANLEMIPQLSLLFRDGEKELRY